MAIICWDYWDMELCASALRQRKLPVQIRNGSVEFKPHNDEIKIMTMRVSKESEFPILALPGIGQMPHVAEEEVQEARLFYGAAT